MCLWEKNANYSMLKILHWSVLKYKSARAQGSKKIIIFRYNLFYLNFLQLDIRYYTPFIMYKGQVRQFYVAYNFKL